MSGSADGTNCTLSGFLLHVAVSNRQLDKQILNIFGTMWLASNRLHNSRTNISRFLERES